MKLTFCIIDDDLVSQFATRYCIQQSDQSSEIMTCSSGEEGISLFMELLEKGDKLPDIVFLDLVMEGMDGWTFLQNMKNLFEGHQLPKVYVLSAFANSKDREIAKAHKLISGYVDKPLSRNYLDKVLKQEGKERTL